ncbi:hypothetical protein [Ornithinimicrobium murale]|uniref:hypothetical protein n=1 Tax=Ornithinimicrobium murale TaxID=1050153 RepID=UPI000E0CEE07|nr:hypothetical protein [Ornithinimicrobium murale]
MGNAAVEMFLRAIATDVTVAEFTRAAAEHPEWMPQRAPSPTAAPVPSDQLDAVLAASGLSADQLEETRREARDPGLGARIALHDAGIAADLLRSSRTAQQVAELLDRDSSNIRRGVQAGRYYAVRVAGALRLPDWQFVERTTYDYTPGEDAVPDIEIVPLPNLSAVVAAIPEGLHPQVIAGFMDTPQPELDDRSPIEWLTGGGDPEPVSDLVAGLVHQ